MEYCHLELIKLLSWMWPIMQKEEDIVWGVHGTHGVFCKEATVALRSLLKVPLLSCLDIVKVDGDKAVPVRPCMLMDKAKSMDQLVNWSHEAFSKTATVEGKRQATIF